MKSDIGLNILLKARKLFETYGLKSVSMDDIAKNLSMSKKTLYQYHEGKSQLVGKIINEFLSEEKLMISEIHNLSSDAIDEMIRIARYVLDFLSNLNPSLVYDLRKYYPESWLIIESDHMKFIEQTIVNNIIRGMEEEVYRSEIQPQIIGALYVSNSMNIVQHQISTSKFHHADIYREMILYHLHGIMTEKGNRLFKQNKTSTYAQV